ncbi:MAG: EamA family transporter [Fusobacteriaceae bacterium]
MNNIFQYLLLLVMTVLGAFGGFFFKKSTEKVKSINDIIKCKELYFGGFLYFVSALINIYILKYLPYIVVLPLTGITYIWTLMISYKFLNEKITKNKKIGVFLIIIGALLISIN